MSLAYVRETVLPAALGLLPPKMDTPPARVLLLAIGLQESRFTHRRQVKGPARGFWQFEMGGGVRGVLTHHASKPLIEPLLAAMAYPPDDCYRAIADNDVLACIFARLLLWTHPRPIPTDREAAWRYYLECWRPGKPHPDSWDRCFEDAGGVR